MTASSQPRTILLADDDEASLVVLGRYLRDEGYQVTVARNGREALEVLSRSTPAGIVLDVHMPEMSGLDIAGRVRRVTRLRGVPLVLVTGLWDGQLDTLAQWEGVGTVLEKPVSRALLIEALQMQAEEARLPGGLPGGGDGPGRGGGDGPGR